MQQGRKLLAALLVFTTALCSAPGMAGPSKPAIYQVHLLIRPTPANDLLTQLLTAALNASKKPGETIQLVFNHTDLSQARWIAELQKGQRNQLIWTITTREREQLLRPIRVPLLRGLYGYRVLAIRPQSASAFAAVHSRAQLAQFTAGMNPHWPDATVFRDNQLPFSEGTFAVNLYRMLAAQRFDYFPRGIMEITEEQPLLDANQLQVESQLLIYYPSALYFFVNKHNVELAGRLERGLAQLLKSGDYDQLFYHHPSIVAALARMKNRRIIQLHNRQIPTDTEQFLPDYFRQHQAGRQPDTK